MRIGLIAEQAGVNIETIRFYERKHLIAQPPRPTNGGFRQYPPETIARVRFIRQAQQLGFSLTEVEELLCLQASPSADCADVRARASAKLDEVNEKLRGLGVIRHALEALIQQCPSTGPTEHCSILDALSRTKRDG